MKASSFTISHMCRYKTRLVAYVLFAVLSVVFTMATALSVADFLKLLFPPAGGGVSVPTTDASLLSQGLSLLYGWLISFGTLRALVYFSVIFFCLYALKNVFLYLSQVQMATVRCRVVRDIRNQLYAKLMRLPVSYFGNTSTGDTLSRFAGDVTEFDESTLSSVQQLVSAIIALVLYLVMLFYISTSLTLFVLCMLPVVVFVISGITRRLRRSSVQLQQQGASLMSLMEETIMGLKVVKAYTAIDFSNRRFRQADSEYARLRTRVLRRVDLSSPVSDFLGNCVVVAILLFGSSIIMRQGSGITSDLFVSYIMMFVLMIPPAKELTTAVSQIKKGNACVDRLQQFLQQPEASSDSPDALPFTGLQQGIEFRDVSFHYNPDVPVLRHVSFSIPRGSTVALVGSSGSGKSTLVNLLLRFNDCTSGQILLDGKPIDSFRIADVRQHIGLVDQTTMLFNDSVYSNIALGGTSHDAQVMQAARAADAHDFITQLPDGYNTNIGDGGDRLSGGQRQRISIARAVLRNPDILVLDEATSSLDTESERQVQSALGRLLTGRTALVVAHRLSTVRGADKIIVLEHGSVVEEGTHDQLVALHGRYYQLLQMQEIS